MKWRKLLFNLLAYLLSIIIGALLVGWCWSWLIEYDEYKAVDILASREIDLGVSVYAQFSLSQLFEVQPEAEITKIILPLYVSDPSMPLLVKLVRDDENIITWRLNSDTEKIKDAGIYEVELNMAEPMMLSGQYNLVITGHDISHENKDRAPRVFVEKDDSKYEAGNYWIADNKKAGDISMQVIGRETRWMQLKNDWQENPFPVAIKISSWLLLLLVVTVGPHVLLRPFVQ